MKRFIVAVAVVGLATLVSGCTASKNLGTANGNSANTPAATAAAPNTNTAAANLNANTVAPNANAAANANSSGEFPLGSMQLEAEFGVLSNQGSDSYVRTTSRGGEASLAEGGATVTFRYVQMMKAGTYTMWVRLADDGQHRSGARNVAVSVNGAVVLRYHHVSENTNGWKWYSLGDVSLNVGRNSVAFEKDESTGAPFVMDAFKLVPVQPGTNTNQ
ncbi:MAG: hypothetical protein V1916_00820 [Patescibacteria group bacterium]